MWWIESTAKYAEYLVYPELLSYTQSANVWIDNPCNDIDMVNFRQEYSKVLIPIYLNNPALIAKSFIETDIYNSYLEFLDYEAGMENLLFNITKCIDKGECFENIKYLHKFPETK